MNIILMLVEMQREVMHVGGSISNARATWDKAGDLLVGHCIFFDDLFLGQSNCDEGETFDQTEVRKLKAWRIIQCGVTDSTSHNLHLGKIFLSSLGDMSL